MGSLFVCVGGGGGGEEEGGIEASEEPFGEKPHNTITFSSWDEGCLC